MLVSDSPHGAHSAAYSRRVEPGSPAVTATGGSGGVDWARSGCWCAAGSFRFWFPRENEIGAEKDDSGRSALDVVCFCPR